MDFITGALPNVMFIAGLIAMGLGLGIEFKIVEIKGELSKPGRFAAMGIGAVLVSISIYLYTRPPHTATPATASGAPPAVVQAGAGGTGSAPEAARVPMDATAPPPKTATSPPPTVTAVPPTATRVPPKPTDLPPTATPMPPTLTRVPPTATRVPPTATAALPTKQAAPTAVPGVMVPDIRGQNARDAQKMLVAAGLRLGESRERCEDIGASDAGRKLKKGQIRCQSPAPGSIAVRNTPVLVVFVGGKDDHDN